MSNQLGICLITLFTLALKSVFCYTSIGDNMKNEKYEILIKDVPIGNKIKLRVINRPKYSYISIFSVGFIFIIYTESFLKLIGVFLIAIVGYSAHKNKDRTGVEIFADYIVVDQGVSRNDYCIYFTWDDIETWYIGPKSSIVDSFIIELKNSETPLIINSFSNFALNNKFQKYAGKKEHDKSVKQSLKDSFK